MKVRVYTRYSGEPRVGYAELSTAGVWIKHTWDSTRRFCCGPTLTPWSKVRSLEIVWA